MFRLINTLSLNTQTSNRSQLMGSTLLSSLVHSLSMWWCGKAHEVRFIASWWHHRGIMLSHSFLSLFLFSKFSNQHRWSAASTGEPAHRGGDAPRWPTRGQRRDGQPDRWWETQLTRIISSIHDLWWAVFTNHISRIHWRCAQGGNWQPGLPVCVVWIYITTHRIHLLRLRDFGTSASLVVSSLCQ